MTTKTAGPSTGEQIPHHPAAPVPLRPEGFVRYAFPWGKEGTPLAKGRGSADMADRRVQAHQRPPDASTSRSSASVCRESDVPRHLLGPGHREVGMALDARHVGRLVLDREHRDRDCEHGDAVEVQDHGRARQVANYGHQPPLVRAVLDVHASGKVVRRVGSRNQLRMDTQYYYIEAQSWSAENPDVRRGPQPDRHDGAVRRGLGYPGPHLASDRGFFTDMAPLRLWLAISNPRRNTGGSSECFHKDRGFWDTKYVDSRTVEVSTPGVPAHRRQVREDHDVTRIEVKGQFPAPGPTSSSGARWRRYAAERRIARRRAPRSSWESMARFGDESVFQFRRA